MSYDWKASLNDLVLAVVVIAGTVAGAEGLIYFIPKGPTLGTTMIKPDKFILSDKCNGKVCQVYFSDSISGPEDYVQLANQLAMADKETTINIHLIGNGGRADTIAYLTNVINSSKAKVVMHVDGNVFSAHAMIAFSGDELKISPLSYFLFHYPAAMDPLTKEYVPPASICNYYRGLDRGISSKDKCLEEMKVEQIIYNTFFYTKIAPYLTKEEIKRYNEGYEVLITGVEMQKRVEQGHV